MKINIKEVEYTAVERDKHWGIEMRFNRSYTNAKGGRLRIYLNSELIDMKQACDSYRQRKRALSKECEGKSPRHD